jgi:enoyl-CoA hydratase/carnithine racemase
MEKTMTVKYEIDGAVGVVTLAKPPHNLVDDALLEDLMTAYQTVVAKGARAILLRSSMRHFCAGAEVQSFGTTTVIHTDKEKFVRLMDAMENVPLPTVAALNGGVLLKVVSHARTSASRSARFCRRSLAVASSVVGPVHQ